MNNRQESRIVCANTLPLKRTYTLTGYICARHLPALLKEAYRAGGEITVSKSLYESDRKDKIVHIKISGLASARGCHKLLDGTHERANVPGFRLFVMQDK